MKRFVLIFCVLAFCAVGCASTSIHAKKTENTTNVNNSEYAYVLVGVQGCTGTRWLHTDRSYFEKYNPDENVYIPIKRDSWKKQPCDTTRFQMNVVKPGKYTLISFMEEQGSTVYFMTDEAREENEKLKHEGGSIASFTADKGTLTYIGTLYQKFELADKWTFPYSFTVSDERSNAEAYMAKEYPNIDPSIIVYRPAIGVK